jgi:hypothetical protein
LIVVLVCEARTLDRDEWRRRARALPVLVSMPPERARSHESSFGFDRNFAPFLEGVRRATPAGATIALLVPTADTRYLFAAAYVLAPRRIVGTDRLTEADFAAAYRAAAPGRPVSAAIPFGSLGARP